MVRVRQFRQVLELRAAYRPLDLFHAHGGLRNAEQAGSIGSARHEGEDLGIAFHDVFEPWLAAFLDIVEVDLVRHVSEPGEPEEQ